MLTTCHPAPGLLASRYLPSPDINGHSGGCREHMWGLLASLCVCLCVWGMGRGIYEPSQGASFSSLPALGWDAAH